MEGETVSFFRLDFHVHCGQEPVFFSQLPMKLTDAVTAQCDQDIRELAQLCTAQQNTVEKNARLFSVFSQLCRAAETPCAQRLLPAVNYLHQNLTKPLDCQQLAALCFVSTTRFYKLFKAQFGTTPLGYRDQLLTERAAMLLQMEDLSIREVADLLGFSDPAYFSRFFKKQTGRSPAQYRAGLQQNPYGVPLCCVKKNFGIKLPAVSGFWMVLPAPICKRQVCPAAAAQKSGSWSIRRH